ncbi:MAG: putative glycoside hydrolase [Bacillota bacterium]|nr:putative glycoside hydrolase [Bacillota bacterium]
MTHPKDKLLIVGLAVILTLVLSSTYLYPVVRSIMMRPWLQDLTIRHKYRVAEIKAQIKAVEDAGFEEWLLWDPRCRYTKDAFTRITP